MKRVLIIGPGNSGKSTLAIKLGEKLNLPVFHIDQYAWRENWVAATKEEKQRIHSEIIAKDEWVLEGNNPSTLDDRIKRADTLIFLSATAPLLVYRWFRRLLKYRGQTRPDMGGKNIERFNWGYLKWLVNYPDKAIIQKLKDGSAGKRLIILRSKQSSEEFLKTL